MIHSDLKQPGSQKSMLFSRAEFPTWVTRCKQRQTEQIIKVCMVKNDRKVQSSALKVPLRLKQSLYWPDLKGKRCYSTVPQSSTLFASRGFSKKISHSLLIFMCSNETLYLDLCHCPLGGCFLVQVGTLFGPDTANLTVSGGISAKTFRKTRFLYGCN